MGESGMTSPLRSSHYHTSQVWAKFILLIRSEIPGPVTMSGSIKGADISINWTRRRECLRYVECYFQPVSNPGRRVSQFLTHCGVAGSACT